MMEIQTTESKSLSLANPQDIMGFANTLKLFIDQNNLSCLIKTKQDPKGKFYAYVDGWKFAGMNFGLTAIPGKPVKEQGEDNEIKYSCEVDILTIGTQNRVGYGFALCSNKESKKKYFDEYAIASMAQTRAIGKAYRNLLGFVMNAAGFESTPAEEMEEPRYSNDGVQQSDIDEVKEQIELVTDLTGLIKYYNQLDEKMKSNKSVIGAFSKRKMELKGGKK